MKNSKFENVYCTGYVKNVGTEGCQKTVPKKSSAEKVRSLFPKKTHFEKNFEKF